MKLIKYIGILILSSLIINSCGFEKEPKESSYGYLKVNLLEDNGLNITATKADVDRIYAVTILNSQDVVIKSYSNHNDMAKDPIKLPVGTYKIKATTGTATDCGFDKPFYSGLSTIDIKAGVQNKCEVVCYLANSKVSAKFDKNITDNFTQIILTIKNTSSGNSLIYSSKAGTINSSGYFSNIGGDLEWELMLTNKNGVISNGEVKGKIEKIKAKTHYILNFKMSETTEDGAAGISVVLDDSMTEKSEDFLINLTKRNKPVYSTNGFVLANTQYIVLNSSLVWKVSVKADAGIKKMELEQNNLTFNNLGLPSKFDIISTPDKSKINSIGITWGNVNSGDKDLSIDFSNLITKLPLGDYEISLSALDVQQQMVDTVFRFKIIPSVETSALRVEPWAKRAYFYGMWNTQIKPEGLGFEYKKVGDTNWEKITSGFTIVENQFSVLVNNLDPATNYIFRTFTAKESSNEIEFVTEKADQIYNMSFDKWYKSGKSYYPNESSSFKWWDSGNDGANLVSEVNPTSPTSTVAVQGDGKQAAKLETKSVFGVLAAGSLFLGDFGKTIGTSGAELYFGREYSCRPLSLKGYYSYAPVAINKTQAPYNDLSGKSDICHIYVVLADWDKPFTVNTAQKKFIDFEKDEQIIAYGELTDNTNTGGYKPFEIELKYKNNRIPKYCAIVCSSSKYGDYFTGGIGSVLYVDEFEFLF